MNVEKQKLIKEITELAHNLGATVDPTIRQLSVTKLKIIKIKLGVKV